MIEGLIEIIRLRVNFHKNDTIPLVLLGFWGALIIAISVDVLFQNGVLLGF